MTMMLLPFARVIMMVLQVTAVLEAMGGKGKGTDGSSAAGGAATGGAAASSSSSSSDSDVRMTTTGTAATGTAGAGTGTGGGGGVPGRTTHMFTATMPVEVERLARKYLASPALVKIGDEDSVRNKRIEQVVVFLPSESRKRGKLVEVLGSCDRPAIVFVNAKKQCDVVAKDLEGQGFPCTVLHAGKAQEHREEALAEFKAGGFDILIATDVAGEWWSCSVASW